MEFLIAPIVSGAAHLMYHSQVSALTGLTKGICIYSMLIGNPSTGKSHALSMVTDALEAIEDFDQIEDVNSNLLNGGFCFFLGTSVRVFKI